MWTTMDSPIDQLRIVEDNGALTRIEFSPLEAHTIPFDDAFPESARADAEPVLAEAVRQLDAYFDGTLKEFDLPLCPAGTEFQRRVWERLRAIPWGETRSYGAIATELGLNQGASRAVGLANGRNPLPVVVPCHRVIGANGKLTGFAGGLRRKQVLLDLEKPGLF